MSNIKISQLPVKGANLAAADLLEVSEFTGTGYVSKSITGQEIIDAASGGGVDWGDITGTLSSQTDLQTALDAKQDDLVSGTNIKTINGSSVLGSGDLVVGGGMRKYVNTTLQTASITPGETLVGSYLIPANTFVSNGSFEFLIKAGVSSGSSSIQARLYINTSSTLTGATLIATSTNNVGGGYFNFVRNAILSSNVISVFGSTFQTNFDLANGGFPQSTVAFDVTANRYFLVSLSPSQGTTAEIRGVKFVQYES
jgi:hypothetical protein